MERKREIGPFNQGSRVERQGTLAELWGSDLLLQVWVRREMTAQIEGLKGKK
jgi:hypothetical protein